MESADHCCQDISTEERQVRRQYTELDHSTTPNDNYLSGTYMITKVTCLYSALTLLVRTSDP